MITVDKKTKFEQIRDNLRNMLATGDFKVGDRFYSENRLAKMFTVARMTVNKVLAVLENEGLLERVQGKGTFVTAMVETLRKQQGVGRTTTIALLSSFRPEHIYDPNFTVAQFINQVDDQAYDLRYKIEVFNFQDQETIPEGVVEELKSGKHAGIILVHLGLREGNREIRRLKQSVSVPMVLGDSTSDLVDSVDYDHEWVGWRGADYLMELGHRNIAFLGFETDMEWMLQRINGFSNGCRENRRSCSHSQIFTTKNSKYGEKALQKQEIADLFDELTGNHSGVMCANDKVAGLLIDVAGERNVIIPEQLSVISVDDDIKLRELNLTTFRFSGEELANVSLGLLKKRMEQPSPYSPSVQLIKPRLMQRNTTTVYGK